MRAQRKPVDPDAGVKAFFWTFGIIFLIVLGILHLVGVEVVRFPEPVSVEDRARGYR